MTAASDCTTTLHEILPEESGGDKNNKYGKLGDLLDILDLACGRTAHRYAGAPVVTASFQDVELYSPIPRGRLIQVSARVISTGRSSILLETTGEAHDAAYNMKRIIRAYATFVCVKKGHQVRALEIAPGDIKSRYTAIAARLSASRKAMGKLYSTETTSCTDGAAAAYGKTIRYQKQYLPRHKNFSEMVFGGDLLEGAIKIAVYAAMQLSPDGTQVRGECVGFKYFNFVKPIAPLNLWGITAKISHVAGNIIYVDLTADIDGDKAAVSHRALYAVVLVDVAAQNVVKPRVKIPSTEATDVDELARKRALLWSEEKDNVLWYTAK